jgi:hypothetical protein
MGSVAVLVIRLKFALYGSKLGDFTAEIGESFQKKYLFIMY